MSSKLFLIASCLIIFVMSFALREHFFGESKIAGLHYENCRRIVSMAPSITETLYVLGLGDRVVGVTRYCAYPAEVQSLPKVGGFLDPNFEAIMALKPDLVILLEEHERSLPGFQKLGLETTVVCHKYITGIVDSLRTIGKICGLQSRGNQVADDIQMRMDRLRAKTARTKRPKVMIAIDRIQGSGRLVDVFIAGADGYFDKMIELAGGENVYRQTTVRFPVVSTEGIMRLNPDVIIDLVSSVDLPEGGPRPSPLRAPTEGWSGEEINKKILADWQGLTNVEAVKKGRVYSLNRDYVIVPGPRFIRFVEDLAQLLHPEIDWKGDCPDFRVNENGTVPFGGPTERGTVPIFVSTKMGLSPLAIREAP
jgi:iron complex transport system substrate-binding protein